MLKWKDLILHHNPDLFTGYNIFGFDFDYINKRVDYLFPCNEKCGRYHDYKCPKHDSYRLGRLIQIEILISLMKIYKNISFKTKNFNENIITIIACKRCQVVKNNSSSSGLG